MSPPHMLTDSPHTPPWVLLLLSTLASSKSWEDNRRKVKELLPELRTQSEVFQSESIGRLDDNSHTNRFEVHLQGGLDPFSGGGCAMLECRTRAADQLARSFGLLADRLWLMDTLTDRFVNFGRVTNLKLDAIVADTLVLSHLLPLIDAGIVRFRSPWIANCQSCSDTFYSEIDQATEAVRRVFRREFRIEDRGEGNYVAHTGKSYEPSIVYRGLRKPGVSVPTARQFAESEIEEAVRSTFWTAREACLTSGTIATNSRIGIAGLLQLEGRLLDRRSIFALEQEREISLPWVSELNAEQIVQLRNEASAALPSFRAAIATALVPSSSREDSINSVSDVIANLRDQAIQVRSELEMQRRSSGRFWKSTYGLLGLGVSAYGVAFDQPAAGVAGLLPVIQLLIDHKRGHEAEAAQLKSKPGYLLVKAQDLLAHSHGP
jgi:hypothetical protein